MNRATAWMLAPTLLATLALGCAPLGDSHHQSYSSGDPLSGFVKIDTGDRRYYYVVDLDRGNCFFADRYRPQLTVVACETVPEAADLLGYPEEPIAPAEETAEIAPPAELPPPATDIEDPGERPTEDERARFENAWVTVFCASRDTTREEPVDLDAVAQENGLTRERYEQIRAYVSADSAAWSALSATAAEACP